MDIASLINPGTLAIICALGGPFVVACLFIVARTLENVVRQWREVSLKNRMVDAGMSAADIERVVLAGQAHKEHGKDVKKPAGKYAA